MLKYTLILLNVCCSKLCLSKLRFLSGMDWEADNSLSGGHERKQRMKRDCGGKRF